MVSSWCMTPWNVLRHQCHVVAIGTEVWPHEVAVVSVVGVVGVVAIVINCFICMTASLYSIAKACMLQSKYKTNNTNNNLKKFSYITDNESLIFIQEEMNIITNLFTWCSFEFIISFMLSGDDFLSYSIDLINECLSLYWVFITLKEKMNLILYLNWVT